MEFAHVDVKPARIIARILEEFCKMLGMEINVTKSNIFYFGVIEAHMGRIGLILGFEIGELPIRYLGVPLITTKLGARDYKILDDRILPIIN